jgi:archaeosine-15-forming tRNA-guanine transglycosylase
MVISMSEKEVCQEAPKRVVISDAAVPFVARGGRVFSGLVINTDPGINDGDIVRVMDRSEHLLSTAYVFIGD